MFTTKDTNEMFVSMYVEVKKLVEFIAKFFARDIKFIITNLLFLVQYYQSTLRRRLAWGNCKISPS